MKKVTLLCLESAKDESLEALRRLGVMHLDAITPPVGGDLDKARAHLDHVQRALEMLPRREHAETSGRPGEEVVDDIWKLIHRRQAEEKLYDELKHDVQRLEPYGNFDPESIRRLAETGITVKLYHAGRGEETEIPENAVRVLLQEGKNGTWFAVIRRGEVNLPLRELRLPEKSLHELRVDLQDVGKELERIDEELASHAGDYGAVAKIVGEAEEQVEYLEARYGMGASGVVAYLQGFCPADKVDGVEKAAAENGWGLVVEEPGPDDKVPTLVRMWRWVRPIRTVFEMIGIVPGYEEVDISPPFLVFLSIFFAMLVGDAGYGALFVILTWVARRFAKKAPGYLFSFMYVMSVSTIVWGVLTGNYFGYFSPDNPLPAALEMLTIPWLTAPEVSEKHIMSLCFFIGATQLTVAHVWNAARLAPSPQALAQVGWVCSTWVMFFAARTMVLGAGFPTPMFWVLAVGIALILLFMTPPKKFKDEWFNHAVLPLNVISNFTDVVSYVRLFAVGSASYAVANAFNEMLLAGGFGGVFSGLVKSLFLFMGHALNIALCGLGILVHGVRLNTLEFSSHVGMQWSGFHYKPFARGQKGDEGAEGTD